MKTVIPPRRLGPYVVGTKIGGGGMASIFLGRQERGDGAGDVVALKVIRDELRDDERFATMFVDEAKILARLSHPNVIRTFEYGIEDGHRFIAMELLSGRTLADVWIALSERGESLTWQVAAWICARIAEGLHSAHELVDEAGMSLAVVHRDVNPANIFLTYGGDVKLIDFGLAKARLRTSKSVDGIVKGKIPYLSPEQAHGEPIDRRTDVYALGTTLWEASTMKRLFKRDTDVATLHAIRAGEVPDARTIDAAIPEGLWRIIERATQRDAEARYETTEALARDLNALIDDPAATQVALTELLARVFPGQKAEHDDWLTSIRFRDPMRTIPPPTPLATASSTMFESADEPSASEERTAKPAEAMELPASKPRRARKGSRERTRTKSRMGHRPPRRARLLIDVRAREELEARQAAREQQSRRAWMVSLAGSLALMVATLAWALR